jgi:hypothetical protein
MAAPVTCLPNVWTQIAPVGFGGLVMEKPWSPLRFEMSALMPTHPTAGVKVGAPREDEDPLREFTTTDSARAAWVRPDGGDAPIIVYLIY